MRKFILAFLLICFLGSGPVMAEQRLLIVGTEEGRYSTIQQAIDAASSGDKVLIEPGTYRENLTIKAPVDLYGTSVDSVVIEPADKSKPVFMIRNTVDSVMENLKIIADSTAIQFTGLSLTVRNCVINSGKYGVFFIGRNATLNITDCVLSGIVDGNASTGPGAYGIMSTGEGEVTVEGSIFINLNNGAYITSKSTCGIKNSSFRENTNGIYLSGSATVTVVENTFENNIETGMFVKGTGYVYLIDNVFSENGEFGLKLSLPACGACGTCKGARFEGYISGAGNVFDTNQDICPSEYPWPENFYELKNP